MDSWQTISSEEVYNTPWIRVRRDEVKTHLDKQLTYSVVELHHPTVFIVAMNDKNEIFLQKNYRYTINQTIWELPAGHSDGEDPLVAAKRELLEETGLISDDWNNLGQFYQAIGVANFPLYIFLARNARFTASQPQDDELIIEKQFFEKTKATQMIRNGDIIDATNISALFMAFMHSGEKTT